MSLVIGHWSLVLVFLSALPAAAVDLAAKRKPLDVRFQEELAALATKCDELGLAEQTQITRNWIVRRDPRRQTLFLPADTDTTRPPIGSSDLVMKWHKKFSEHRQARAEALFKLAEEAATNRDIAASWQLIYEVVHEDPNHAQARRMLGYLPPGPNGVWRRGGGASAPRKSPAPHPILGKPIWKVETPHFSISSNHTDKSAAELGLELERLYDAWQQLFASNWLSGDELKKRFDHAGPPPVLKAKHVVVLFKSREDYLEKLAPHFAAVGLSKGFYDDGKKVVYLYAGQERIRSTWYHEATHQLFQETGKVAPAVGIKQNCWIIEGIAMYLESLVAFDGYCTVGGFDAERLQDARYRHLCEEFHLPLADLVKLGRDDLKVHKDLRKLYSESAGLAHFLMDHKQGKYRGALVDCLAAVYQGRDHKETLATLSGARLSDLDVEYRASLSVTDDDLAALNPSPHVPALRLGRTAVSDKGLKHLAGHVELETVDLSDTRTTDAGLAFLKDAAHLQELILDGTGVTDASLAAIGKLRELEYLDLANLPISDAGLLHLSGLKNLKTLYLTNTKITDAGLAHLSDLKLETLDAEGTAVTAEGLKRLRGK